MGTSVQTTRKSVVATVALCTVFLCAWIVFGSRNAPIDRRVSNVALSSSGRWLAAGTAKGKIVVWDQAGSDGPRHTAFPHGALNDLHFSADERLLAIASKDLGLYVPAESAAPRL